MAARLLIGPRSMKVWTTWTGTTRWEERCPHVISSMEHALRHSTLIDSWRADGKDVAFLGYRLERVIFVVKREPDYPSWGMADVYSSVYCPWMFGRMTNEERRLYGDFTVSDSKRAEKELGYARFVEGKRKGSANYLRRLRDEAKKLLTIRPIQAMHAEVDRRRSSRTSTLGASMPGQFYKSERSFVLGGLYEEE